MQLTKASYFIGTALKETVTTTVTKRTLKYNRHEPFFCCFSSLSAAIKEESQIDGGSSTCTSSSIVSSPSSRLSISERIHIDKVESNSIRRPRLEKLRKELKRSSDIHLLNSAAVPNVSNSISKNGRVKQQQQKNNTNKPSSSLSWQDILKIAKENREDGHLSMLTDSYSREHTYLRISLVERCNLRCQYCMPPEGIPLQKQDKLLQASEIDRLVQLFSSNGVDKVRLTGGEPLLRKDLAEIISSISLNPTIQSIGITTNGITLSRKLQSLVDAGLTHVNISLDTLQPPKFKEITRRNGLSQVLRSIEDACHALPTGNVKVNCVVMKRFNDNELRDFIGMTKDLPIDVRFIEWMPFNDNGWSQNRFVSYKDMMAHITSDVFDVPSSLQGLPPVQLMREEDGPNDTTKWWKAPDHVGRVGFITSMSEHFCGTCNRLRITADGQLKACLFGSAEVSLRDAMRDGVSDEDLSLIVNAAVRKKKFALGGHGSAEGIKKANDNRPMTLIGG